MKITDALLGEHGLFYAYFDILAERINAADHGAARTLANALDTLLRSHAKAEEDLLFPAMEGQMGEVGPLAMMRQEHQEIDRLLDEIAGATDDSDVAPLLGELLELIYSHFHKEEAVLFHMAEQFLDEATLLEMGRRWAGLRQVTLEAEGCAA